MKRFTTTGPRPRRPFTLLELLVVISVIAILIGMLFPAIMTVKMSARRAKTRAVMSGIIAAIKSYESTYGLLPWTNQDPDEDEDKPNGPGDEDGTFLDDDNYDLLMEMLTLADGPDADDDPTVNKRQIRFLDAPIGFKTESLIVPHSGHNKMRFRIAMDLNYDGKVKYPCRAPEDPNEARDKDCYGSVFIMGTTGNGADTVYSWR